MKNKIPVIFIVLLTVLLFVQTVLQKESFVDEYARGYDFNFVLDATGTDREGFLLNLSGKGKDDFAKGDVLLVTGRLTKDDNTICSSIPFYKNALKYAKGEEKAILLETIASIGCGENRSKYLIMASEEWKTTGNEFRSELDRKLALNQRIEFNYNISELPAINISVPENAEKIVIGMSCFRLNESDILVSQTDRVSRDWLSYQIYNSPYSDTILTVFSERLTYTEEELLPDIGWHEGARIKEIKENTGLKHEIASGTLVKKIKGKWYAPNENGVFMFDIPIDKLLYPTTRFLRDDIAVIIDTHGINMLVEQAIRKNATIVVGCCDNVGKIKAVKYLSERRIKAICFTDKYLPLILGSKANALGSPPIKGNIIGNQSIEINLNETVIVQNVSSDKFSISYYTTPAIYFTRLNLSNAVYVNITDFNQMKIIIEKAEKLEANVIAVRIFNSDDYSKVKTWLEKDKRHRAVLFHSVSYPYGYKLIKEYPNQTTFDDINPVFI